MCTTTKNVAGTVAIVKQKTNSSGLVSLESAMKLTFGLFVMESAPSLIKRAAMMVVTVLSFTLPSIPPQVVRIALR